MGDCGPHWLLWFNVPVLCYKGSAHDVVDPVSSSMPPSGLLYSMQDSISSSPCRYVPTHCRARLADTERLKLDITKTQCFQTFMQLTIYGPITQYGMFWQTA